MKLVPVLFLLLAPVLTSCFPPSLPVDCTDIYNLDISSPSGVYTIFPAGLVSAVQVYCEINSGEQWMVIQKRMDGSVNFYRPWEQYKKGFGNAAGEYWLGLQNILILTHTKSYELLVDMEDFEGNKVFARYSSFSIDPERFGYKLYLSGFTDGGAGDSMGPLHQAMFSTFDQDQDSSESNCAKEHLGAFWYTNCQTANPNGVYHWGADATHNAVGVNWFTWKGYDYSLKAISMKIHPRQ